MIKPQHGTSLQGRRVHSTLLIAPLLALGFWLFSASPAHAAQIPVSATCTITQAITAANNDSAVGGCAAGSGADTVVLTPTLYSLSEADNFSGDDGNGLPQITSTVTISGNGATIARDLAFTCPGGDDPDFRLFYVTATGDLTLHDLTLRNGCVTADEFFSSGGAINIIFGSVTLLESALIGNTAASLGGAIANGNGAVFLQGSSIYSNTAGDFGGGIHNGAGELTVTAQSQVYANRVDGGGGGVYNFNGTVKVQESAVYSNSASSGGGVYNDLGTMTVQASDIYSNTAENSGGGFYNTSSGVTTITEQSQIYDNSAFNGGGIAIDFGRVSVQDSALLFNSADDSGGALYQFDGESSITGSCIVGNSDTAVFFQDGNSPIIATDNWWGAANGPFDFGPGDGDSVSDDVDFDPFEITPIFDCPTLEPDLTLVKTATPGGTVKPGQTITYTLVFTNVGTDTASNVVLTDTLPAQVQLTGVDGNIAITETSAAPELVWDVTELEIGAGGTITLVAVVTDTLTADVTFTNTTVIASDNDVDLSDNAGAVAHSVQLPRVHFASAAYSAFEDSGSATITVTLDAANPYADVTVDYATSNGTASAGSDYSAASGTLTIPAGQSSAAFDVPLGVDTTVEADATVNLSLSSPLGAVLGSPNSATLTIRNDDSATVTLTRLSADQNEGDSGSTAFTFRATLDNPVAGGPDVAYTTNDGTATVADNDYTDNDGTLNFNGTAGEQITITVQVQGDATVENDEQFSVALGAISGLGAGIDAGDISTAGSPQSGTIRNDDSEAQLPSVRFSSAAYSALEDSGTATITVTLNAANPDADVTVEYSTADDTATAGDDYTVASGTLTIPAGQTSAVFTVTLTADVLVEPDETVNLTLDDPTGATLGSPNSATLTLLDDETQIYLPQIGTR